jgi:hypothetical protein
MYCRKIEVMRYKRKEWVAVRNGMVPPVKFILGNEFLRKGLIDFIKMYPELLNEQSGTEKAITYYWFAVCYLILGWNTNMIVLEILSFLAIICGLIYSASIFNCRMHRGICETMSDENAYIANRLRLKHNHSRIRCGCPEISETVKGTKCPVIAAVQTGEQLLKDKKRTLDGLNEDLQYALAYSASADEMKAIYEFLKRINEKHTATKIKKPHVEKCGNRFSTLFVNRAVIVTRILE